MKVTLERKNDNYLFHGIGQTGVPIPIDNTSEPGATGASPMELLLMGVGACSAIDVIFILKKQRQVVTGYTMEVTGERTQIAEAKPFKAAKITLFLEGDIKPEKALRAAALSFEKYCSVSLTLEPCVGVSYQVVLNGTPIQ